jgi:hypothetical protein
MPIKPAPLLLHLTVLCLCRATVAPAAPPVSNNRAPAPDEWGYRPGDGSTVRLNPPSLT